MRPKAREEITLLEIERATAVEFDERVNLALKHLFAAARS